MEGETSNPFAGVAVPARAGHRAWLGPAAVAVVMAAALAVIAGRGDGYRYLLPVHAGAYFARPGVLLPGQPLERTSGADGQFAFYIAQDPFLTRPDTVASLDSSYRYRRILYPLLAWMLAGGMRWLVAPALVVVNLAALVVITACAAALAVRGGRPAWTALVITLYPGTWIPALWDLTDTTSAALMAAGALFDSAPLLLLAMFGRETAGALLAARAAVAGLRRDRRRALRALAALAVFAAWAGLVWWRLPGMLANPANLEDRQRVLVQAFVNGDVPALILPGPMLIVCILALARIVAGRRDELAIAAGLSAVILLLASQPLWLDGIALYRAGLPVALLVFLSWCRAADRLGLMAVAVIAAMGLMGLAGAAYALTH